MFRSLQMLYLFGCQLYFVACRLPLSQSVVDFAPCIQQGLTEGEYSLLLLSLGYFQVGNVGSPVK